MKRTDKIHLVYINKQPYLMVNPFNKLTIGMCNSQVTKEWGITDADLNTDVFKFFKVDLIVIPVPFDRRTAQFRHFEKTLRYFTVEYLPVLATINNKTNV